MDQRSTESVIFDIKLSITDAFLHINNNTSYRLKVGFQLGQKKSRNMGCVYCRSEIKKLLILVFLNKGIIQLFYIKAIY